MDSNHRYLQAELPLPQDRDWAENWILRICANSARRPGQNEAPARGIPGLLRLATCVWGTIAKLLAVSYEEVLINLAADADSTF
jgi:hypothetical protein